MVRAASTTSCTNPASTTRHHVALVGFAGSGKTSVGKELAARLGYDLVDLDEVIAEAAGASVREIYRNHGEVGFRARERAVVRDLMTRSAPMVLATGGGTFVDPTMREWICGFARTVYLQASPEVLVARIAQTKGGRPLRGGPDLEQTIRRHLKAYGPLYEQSDVIVRTDLARSEQLVEDIIKLLRYPSRAVANKKTDVEPHVTHLVERASTTAGRYTVHFGEDAGEWLTVEILKVSAGPIAVISDDTVSELHAATLIADLERHGRKVSKHVVPAGSRAKSLVTAARLYDELFDAGLQHGGAVVAVGGRGVGDLSGFVSATFSDGVPLVWIPTTTAAVLDVSSWDRAALDTVRGDNVVRITRPPETVLVSLAHLATQSRRVHAAGLCLLVELGVTSDVELLQSITAAASDLLDVTPQFLPVLRQAIEAASKLPQGRPKLGATLAAVMAPMPTGEALALGMAAEAEWGENEGAPRKIRQQILDTLAAFELPIDWRSQVAKIEALQDTERHRETSVRLPHLSELGVREDRTVPIAALREFLRSRSKP